MGGRKFRRVDLSGKVYIVTGCNAGLGEVLHSILLLISHHDARPSGYETAKELARMGATVVMACRNVDKAKTAKDRICKATKCKSSQVLSISSNLSHLLLICSSSLCSSLADRLETRSMRIRFREEVCQGQLMHRCNIEAVGVIMISFIM
jgi:hypothetical protein